MDVVVDKLFECAVIVGILHERGEEVPIGVGLKRNLLRIYRNKLLPEAYNRFMATTLEPKIHHLSHMEQKKLADGGTVKLYNFHGDKWDYRNCDPLTLSPAQVNQIFSVDGIRDEGEQRTWYEAHIFDRVKQTEEPGWNYKINKKKKKLVVKHGDDAYEISLSAILAEAASLV
jgi:hypothetical protein